MPFKPKPKLLISFNMFIFFISSIIKRIGVYVYNSII